MKRPCFFSIGLVATLVASPTLAQFAGEGGAESMIGGAAGAAAGDDGALEGGTNGLAGAGGVDGDGQGGIQATPPPTSLLEDDGGRACSASAGRAGHAGLLLVGALAGVAAALRRRAPEDR